MNGQYEIKITKNHQDGKTTISLAKKVNTYGESEIYVQKRCDELKEVVKRFSHFLNCSVFFQPKGSKTSTSEYKIPEAYFEKGHGWRESFVGEKSMNHFPNSWYETASVSFKNFKTMRPINALLDHFRYTLKPMEKEAIYGVIARGGQWIKQIG